MNDKLTLLIAEINSMNRQELITAKQELIPDKEIPKHERSQLLVAIDTRLSQMKNFEKTVSKIEDKKRCECYFVSFESDGEKLSAITNKTLGQFVLEFEPEIVYSYGKISFEEFNKLKNLGYGKV